MTVRTTGLAFAVLMLAAVSALGDDVTLRWKFRKDNPYHYVLTQKTEMSSKVLDKEITQKIAQILDFTWKVREVKPDGAAEMTQTIDRMRMKMEGPGGSIEIDSNQKEGGDQAGLAGMFRKSMEGLIGTPMELVMSPRGQVQSVKVPEKLLQTIRSAGQGVGGQFSEKGLKQLFEQSLIIFPEKPVSPGATWMDKRSMESPGMGNVEVETTYTDKGDAPGKQDLHQIDGAYKIQFRQPENAQVAMKVTSQDNAAKFYFNTAAGLLSHSALTQKMQMEVSTGGQSFTQNVTQTVTMELAGEASTK